MKYIVVILFSLLCASGYSQGEHLSTLEQKKEFLKGIDWNGDVAWLSVYQENDSLLALLEMTEECDLPYEKAAVLSLLGSSKGRAAQFDEAVNYYQESIKLFVSLGREDLAALNECYIGVEFFSRQEYEKSKIYYRKGMEVLKESGGVDYCEPLIGLADVYLVQDSIDQAEEYLKELEVSVLNLLDAESHYYKRYLESKAVLEFKIGNYDAAVEALKECLEFDKKEEMTPAIINTYAMLAQINLHQEKFAPTILYLDSAQQVLVNSDMDLDIFLRDIYKIKGRAYKDLGIMDSSIFYYKSYHQLKQELQSKVNETELNELLAQLEVSELTVNELQDKKRMQELHMHQRQEQFVLKGILLIAGVLVLFGTAIVISLTKALQRKKQILQVKQDKSRVDQQLLENQLEQQKVKEGQLSREIGIKQQELQNIAQEIGRKNHFTRELSKRIKSLVSKSVDDKKLKELIFYVHSSLELNDSYNELQNSIEENNARFFGALMVNYPSLTSSEKHIAGLIRLGLSSKEIAGVRNITVPSVEVARHRLRKKMALEKEVNLTNYLNEI